MTCYKDDKRVTKYFNMERMFLKNTLRSYIEWTVPDTIDDRALNDMTLFNGYAVGYEYKGDVVVTLGALSGIDIYNRPTIFTSANPLVIPAQTRKVGKSCVVCYNTWNYRATETFNGVINAFAQKLAEIDVAVDTSVKNSKVCIIPVVKDDKDAIRTANVLEKMYDGEPAVLAYKNSFSNDAVTLFPIKARDNIVVQELADARRNVMSDFYEFFGIDTVTVDKKERVTVGEQTSGNQRREIARRTILEPRERFCEEMNEMFGLNMSVKLKEAPNGTSENGITETRDNQDIDTQPEMGE